MEKLYANKFSVFELGFSVENYGSTEKIWYYTENYLLWNKLSYYGRKLW